MPWQFTVLTLSPLTTLNQTYPFSIENGSAPVSADLRGAPAGGSIKLTYLGGLVDGEGPKGTLIGATYGFQYPTDYVTGGSAPPYYQGQAVGAFCDESGELIEAVSLYGLGNGPMTLTIPAGAVQFQIGVNWGGINQSFLTHSGSWTFGILGIGPEGLSAGAGILIINEPVVVINPSPLVTTGGLTDQSARLHFGEGPGGLGGSEQTKYSAMLKQRGVANIAINVAAGDPYMPTAGTQVFLYDVSANDQDAVFSGTIDTIQTSWWGTAGDRLVAISVQSFEQCLDAIRIYPGRLYIRENAGFIFTDLFQLAQGSPIVLGNITNGPVVDTFLIEGFPTIAETYDKLCKLEAVQFVWSVDPGSLKINFGPPAVNPAPFTVQQSDVIWEGVDLILTRQDFRDRQILVIDYDAFGRSAQWFQGAGQTVFQLSHPVHAVTNAWITRNTQNTAQGQFTGIPTNGDSVTISYPTHDSIYNWAPNSPYVVGQIIIDPNNHTQICIYSSGPGPSGEGLSGATEPAWDDTGGTTRDNYLVWQDKGDTGFGPYAIAVYTWVDVIDNTKWGQVLIASTEGECCQNLIDAINCNDLTRGVAFSFPTWENQLCNADEPNVLYGNTFTIRNKYPGRGFIAALTSAPSTSNFQWTGTVDDYGQQVTNGGITTFGTSAVSVGPATAQSQGLTYTPGSTVVQLYSPLNYDTNLQVEYQRLDGNATIVEDTALVIVRAAIENGTGKYHALASDPRATAQQGLNEAISALSSYKILPETLEFLTYRPGLKINQLLTFGWNFPDGPDLEAPQSNTESKLLATVTINHALCGYSDSTGFTFLFKGTYAALRNVAYGGYVNSISGFDIVFTVDIPGIDLLTWEIESYDPTTGSIVAWVLLPVLYAYQDTVIYIQIGNPSITTFQGGPVGAAWNEYEAVYHFGDGTTISYADSSGNGNTGTPSGSGLAAISGVINGGVNFDGSGDAVGPPYPFIDCPFNLATEQGSVEFWMNISGLANALDRFLFGFYNATPPYAPGFYTSGLGVKTISLQFGIDAGSGQTIAAGTWIRFLMVWDNAAGLVTLYANANTSPVTYFPYNTAAATTYTQLGGYVHAGATGGYYWGELDEFRFSRVPRTHDWAIAAYNSEFSPQTFYSISFGAQWVVQEVEGEMVPAYTNLGGNQYGEYGIMRYTIRAVNLAQIGSWIDFWASLGGGSSTSGSGAIGSSATFNGTPFPSPDQQVIQKFVQFVPWPFGPGTYVVTHKLGTSYVTVDAWDANVGGNRVGVRWNNFNIDQTKVYVDAALPNTFEGDFPVPPGVIGGFAYCLMLIVIG